MVTRMPRSVQLGRHAICAALIAAFCVTLPQPLLVVALVVWVVGLTAFSIYACVRYGASRVPACLAVHLGVWLLTSSIAEILPVKSRERYLERMVALPASEMTLKDLTTYVDGQGRDQFPVPVYLDYPESQAEHVIRWPSRTIKLKEFVSRIEEQSSLEYMLAGCGNSRTILWGVAPDELCLLDPNWSE